MARPFKQGLEYFPFETDFFGDPKIQDLILAYGHLGVVIYIRILTLVYRNGYYLETSVSSLAKRIYRDFHSQWLTRVERVQEVICQIAELGLVEAPLVAKGIITSVSIQKQWLISTRKRKNINKEKYWLLDASQELAVSIFNDTCEDDPSTPNFINGVINGVIDGNNEVNSVDNTQKEKEKEKIKKDKYDKRKKPKDDDTFGAPKLHFLTKVLIQDDYIKDADSNILRYNDLFIDLTKEYRFEMVLAVTNYLCKYAKRASIPIIDKFDFFRASAIDNCDMLRKREMRGPIDYGEEIRKLLEKLGK